MGIVHAEITLKNVKDAFKAKDGLIKDEEIRQATVQAIVDTVAGTLVINEKLCQQLGLEVRGTKQATLADDRREIVKIVDPVEVHWKNREMICQPRVISSDGEVLLGAIPLEDMDLIVDPARQVLTGAHGDEIVVMLK